jgi:DNA-binding transcriptional ArsR family regulator
MVPEQYSSKQSADRLSLIFGALAHPARREILSRLATGDASIAELAKPFDVSVRAVSKHVAVLERAGLVMRSRAAQKRPSHLDEASLRYAHDWLDAYRALWEKRFNRIDTLLDHEGR